jgi:hypothetical protein
MLFNWSRERWAATAGAIILTIALPIAIDQGYFRNSVYALPLLGLAAALTYVGLFVTSKTFNSVRLSFNAGFARRHEVAGLLIPGILGVTAVAVLVTGFVFAVSKSAEHIASIDKPPPTPKPEIAKPVLAAVTVTPERMEFRSVMAGYGSTYTFTIKSNSDSDLYSVVAKLSIESEAIQRQVYEVSANEGNRRLIYEGEEGKIYDPVILDIVDNGSHFPGAWILVYRLKAHESRDIDLRLSLGDNSSVNVSSSILCFQTTPQPLVADKGRVMFKFLDKWIGVWFEPKQQ